MLMMMFNMMIVTSRSLGEERSLATSCLRLSASVLKALTFIEESEKRATSEEEKKAETEKEKQQ